MSDQKLYFDPFQYSSGEGARAFSDSQNVFYGFPVCHDMSDASDVNLLNPLNDNRERQLQDDVSYSFGVTPETPVNYYGNVPYPFVTRGDGFYGPKTARLAKFGGGGVRPMVGQASGGAATRKFSESGISTQVSPPISGDPESSDNSQLETAVNKNFQGQLGDNKKLAPDNSQMWLGAALIALAFVV